MSRVSGSAYASRVSGSAFVFRESIEFELSISVTSMFSLYTSSPVLDTDLPEFRTQLQAYYETVLTSIGSFQVIVPRQEECKGMNRCVATVLVVSPFLKSGNHP